MVVCWSSRVICRRFQRIQVGHEEIGNSKITRKEEKHARMRHQVLLLH